MLLLAVLVRNVEEMKVTLLEHNQQPQACKCTIVVKVVFLDEVNTTTATTTTISTLFEDFPPDVRAWICVDSARRALVKSDSDDA